MSTPRPRSASSSGAIGRTRACSSPSNSTASVLSAATGGTKRSTVPARPQSTRAPGCGAMAPLIVSSVPAPSTCNAERLQCADHQVGVAAAQRAADGRRPVRQWPARRAPAPGWSATWSPAPSRWRAPGSASTVPCQVLTASILPCRDPRATMGYMCGRFAVTTDPALLAEKIKAIDEATVGREGHPGRQLQRRTDHDDQHGRQAPHRTGRRVDAAGAVDALGPGAAVGQDRGGRWPRTPRARC